MRSLLGFLISLMGIFGGLTGYLWYDTQARLQQFVNVLKPFAEVRYRHMYTSPLGHVGIDGLEILPYGVDDALRIDKVRLKAINLFSLLTMNRAIVQGRLPKSLHLVLDDVQLSFNSRLLKNQSFQLPFGFTLCGNVPTLGSTEFQALGYDFFHLNLDLGYHINELKSSMQLTAKFSQRDMLTTATEARFTLTQPIISLTDLVALSPRLSELTITLTDNSLIERLNRFCAQKENLPVPTYIDEQADHLQRALQAQGVTLSTDLSVVYRDFTKNGGQIKVTALPTNPVSWQELQHRNSEDTLELLNLAIMINNLPVTSLSSEFHEPKTFGYSKNEVASDTIRLNEKQSNTQRYRSIEFDKLPDYLGNMAIIHTVNGSQHKGKLEAIDRGTIRLARQMRGGSVTFTLRIYEIKKVLVAQ